MLTIVLITYFTFIYNFIKYYLASAALRISVITTLMGNCRDSKILSHKLTHLFK